MRFFIVILSSLLLNSCFFVNKSNDITNRLDENISAYLDSITPYMKDFANGTDTIYDFTIHEEMYFLHAVGKFIDGKEIYALHYCEKDTLLYFYHFESPKWEQIGSRRLVLNEAFIVEYTDMDNDNRNEIIAKSHPNMNGNRWQDVFYCSKKDGKINHAGTFTTEYTINKEKKTVETDYEGSWYTPLKRTLYKWDNERLIMVKAIEIESIGSEERIFSYYENTSLKRDSITDSLTLIYKTPYIEKEHRLLWDNFFKNN